jgi:hypothetical protein
VLTIRTYSTAPRKTAYANKTGRGIPENEEEEDEDAGQEEDDEEVRKLCSHSNNHCDYSSMILELKKSRVFQLFVTCNYADLSHHLLLSSYHSLPSLDSSFLFAFIINLPLLLILFALSSNFILFCCPIGWRI